MGDYIQVHISHMNQLDQNNKQQNHLLNHQNQKDRLLNRLDLDQ
jgi:hypothetical protein